MWLPAFPCAQPHTTHTRKTTSASDPKAEGRRICVELMQEYQTIPGVAGVHLMAPLNEAAVPAAITEFRAQSSRN